MVFFALGRRKASSSQDETTACLRRTVQKMLQKHELLFNGMVRRLKVSYETDLRSGFQEMSGELFVHDEVRRLLIYYVMIFFEIHPQRLSLFFDARHRA